MPKLAAPKTDIVFRNAKPSFGPYPDILPSQTHDKAKEARNNVRDGIDPHAKRVEQRTAVRRHAADSFRKMARDWLEFKRKEWATETYRKASTS